MGKKVLGDVTLLNSELDRAGGRGFCRSPSWWKGPCVSKVSWRGSAWLSHRAVSIAGEQVSGPPSSVGFECQERLGLTLNMAWRQGGPSVSGVSGSFRFAFWEDQFGCTGENGSRKARVATGRPVCWLLRDPGELNQGMDLSHMRRETG